MWCLNLKWEFNLKKDDFYNEKNRIGTERVLNNGNLQRKIKAIFSVY